MNRMRDVVVIYKRDRFKKQRKPRIVHQKNDFKNEHPHETAHRLLDREGTRASAAEIAWQRLQNHEKGTDRHTHWLAVVRALRRPETGRQRR